jgi:hypothetical protein
MDGERWTVAGVFPELAAVDVRPVRAEPAVVAFIHLAMIRIMLKCLVASSSSRMGSVVRERHVRRDDEHLSSGAA